MSTIKIAMSFKERFPKCCPFSFKFVKILRWRNNKKTFLDKFSLTVILQEINE